jgi:phage shock protein PspC (stress-responsive transcriptional regulator)
MGRDEMGDVMSSSASILMRDDTMFGVCQALGEDLGLPPTLLRILFALVLFWSPVAALAGYGLAGLLVALSRWLVPEPVAAAEPEAARAAAANDDLQEQAQAWEELARAA